MLHNSRSVSSRMPQTKGANVNYSPTDYTIGRISCSAEQAAAYYFKTSYQRQRICNAG